jgi:hypothetical protein
MAEFRNAEIVAESRLELNRKYGEYDGQTLNGVEVIALLREAALNRAECQIVVDSLTLDYTNYANFTFGALKNLVAADTLYLAQVSDECDEIKLIRV